MNEKPQILGLDLSPKAIKLLEEKKFNVYKGSLGKVIDTENKKHEHKYCLLNHDFPTNIHEFDVVIADLSHLTQIKYDPKDHTKSINKTSDNTYLLCEYPQTVFDPRGLSSHFLASGIRDLFKREVLIIVFQNENEVINYVLATENGNRPYRIENQSHSLYSFLPEAPVLSNKSGKETKVASIEDTDLFRFLNKFNLEFTYDVIFKHPTVWKDENKIKDSSFYPLVLNKDGEIVSYLKFLSEGVIMVFPKMIDNSEFLLEFLQSIAPTISPNLFPFSSENKWTESLEYALPNHETLLREKEIIGQEYNRKIELKNQEIKLNEDKHKFLHDILIHTGDDLVKSVIKFLEWLGFENIKDMDGEKNGIKEEDIAIECEAGLLIIEVKGIGGTSKDAECNQISKIKYRRSKERNKFDVFGLYLVNHQRHQPPRSRNFPPFAKDQIEDSLNDERGLLTTWQLFNLYFDIEDGILTKEEARNMFFNFGFIEFKPKHIVEISCINEIFEDGHISILNIGEIELVKGEEIYVEKDKRFTKAKIIEIQVNSKSELKACKCEAGIKTDIRISKKSKVWKKILA